MTKRYTSAGATPTFFDSARDAIDAVSAYEAVTLENLDYHIQHGHRGAGYYVEVRRSSELPTAHARPLVGFLREIAEGMA